ncbi:MAG: GNAT family N-acetyltransferase [Acidimicrobiia bacterium]
MTVTFRPAKPADVEQAIPLIYSSGPDAFSYVFAHATKGDAQAFLGRAFVDGGGTFGYRNHTVAESNGNVIGIGATYSGDGALATTAAVATQIFKAYGTSAPGIIGRGLRIERVMPPPKKSVQYIAHLGVNPAHQGEGIGSHLIDRFLAQGRKDGKRVAELDVSVENPGAERLYERLGFTVSELRTSNLANEFGTVVDHHRMVMEL